MDATTSTHRNHSAEPKEPGSALRIILNGAGGRMGARIAACADGDRGIRICHALGRGQAVEIAPGGADVVVDFSSPAGTVRAAELAEVVGCALLVGTTGLTPESVRAVGRASARVPAMIAPNTSLGVAVARRLVEDAARLLRGFDTDIVETHHARKADAPSGTAKALAEAVGRGRGNALDPAKIHAIRAGDVVGQHVVCFAGPGEVLRISHEATGRDLFALGALRMARWLASRGPGLHAPDDWFADFCRD